MVIFAVTVFSLNVVKYDFQLPTVLVLFELFIVLTCGQLLYMGSTWARWVIGSLLLLSGCMFTYLLFALLDDSSIIPLGAPVFVVLGTSSLVLGL